MKCSKCGARWCFGLFPVQNNFRGDGSVRSTDGQQRIRGPSECDFIKTGRTGEKVFGRETFLAPDRSERGNRKEPAGRRRYEKLGRLP